MNSEAELPHGAGDVRGDGAGQLLPQLLLELAGAGRRAVLGAAGAAAAGAGLPRHLHRLCRPAGGARRAGDGAAGPAHRARHLHQRAAGRDRHGGVAGRPAARAARHRGAAARPARRLDRCLHRLLARLLRGLPPDHHALHRQPGAAAARRGAGGPAADHPQRHRLRGLLRHSAGSGATAAHGGADRPRGADQGREDLYPGGRAAAGEGAGGTASCCSARPRRIPSTSANARSWWRISACRAPSNSPAG